MVMGRLKGLDLDIQMDLGMDTHLVKEMDILMVMDLGRHLG
jgi:hypothetical protein